MEDGHCGGDLEYMIQDEDTLIEGVSNQVLFVVVLSVAFLGGLLTLLCRYGINVLGSQSILFLVSQCGLAWEMAFLNAPNVSVLNNQIHKSRTCGKVFRTITTQCL